MRANRLQTALNNLGLAVRDAQEAFVECKVRPIRSPHIFSCRVADTGTCRTLREARDTKRQLARLGRRPAIWLSRRLGGMGKADGCGAEAMKRDEVSSSQIGPGFFTAGASRDRIFNIPVRKSVLLRSIGSRPSAAHSEPSETVPPKTRDTVDLPAGPDRRSFSRAISSAEMRAQTSEKWASSTLGGRKLRDCRRSAALVNSKKSA